MQEAVGYAQKVGVPCVFVNVMRVGPATGMPTMPGQGDIMQVKWGSTGDYTPIAFYPNGVEEAFRVTVTAFNAAEESQLAGRHPVRHVRRAPQRGRRPGRDGRGGAGDRARASRPSASSPTSPASSPAC